MAITEYDWNHDGYKEAFTGQTGIYLPLDGKDVTFDLGNGPDTGDESPLPTSPASPTWTTVTASTAWSSTRSAP